MSIDLSKMPKIGFGLMRLPENDGVIDIDKVSKMADSYLEAGFTYFDTAYVYHGSVPAEYLCRGFLPPWFSE